MLGEIIDVVTTRFFVANMVLVYQRTMWKRQVSFTSIINSRDRKCMFL